MPKIKEAAVVKKPTVKKKAPVTAAKTAKKAPKKKVAVKKVVVKRAAKPKAPKKERPPKKVNYLNNKDILKDVIFSKEQGKMSDELAKKLQTLCARYGRKANFANYTYNDDMQAYAMMMLVRTWNSFKPEKSNNPFAFFTQCIKNSFIQFLNQERKQRDIRDVMLVDNGLSPSLTYEMAQAEAQKKAMQDETSNDEAKEPTGDDPSGTNPSEELLKY